MNVPSCAGLDDDTMFPDEESDPIIYSLDLAEAKRICAVCPATIKMDCLSGALQRGEQFGVWGGVDMNTERGALIRTIKELAAA